MLPTAHAIEPKLRVRDLNFYYGGFRALKDVGIDIPSRKVTAFIGPSGCGKSTLLRVFNRMYALYPDQRAEGEVLMDGENLLTSKQDVALLRAKIGMVFQKPTPFPMTIFENIAFGVRLYESLDSRAMQRRCCCPPESPLPDCPSLSLTSFHNAARFSAHSTRSSISALFSRSNSRTPNATLS